MQRAFGAEALALSAKAGTALAAVGAGIVAIGVAGIGAAGKIKRLSASFETLLGNKDAADDMIKSLRHLDDVSSFDFDTYSKAAQKLIAMDYAADQVVPTLTTLGDAAAALGKNAESVDLITLALSQMSARGRVSSQDMNQLTEQSVKGWQYLAEATGKSVGEVRELAEKGMLDGKAAVATILAGMQKDYAGSMSKIENETTMVWETIKSNAGIILAGVGDAFDKAFHINESMRALRDWLIKFKDVLGEKGVRGALDEMIPPGVQVAIVGLAGAITGAAIPALIKFTTAATAALVPMLPYIALGASIAATAWVIYKAWKPLGDLFTNIWKYNYEGVKFYWNAIKTQIMGAVDLIVSKALVPLYEALGKGDKIKGFSDSIHEAFVDAKNDATAGWKAIGDSRDAIFQAGIDIGKSITGGFKEVISAATETKNKLDGLKPSGQSGGTGTPGPLITAPDDDKAAKKEAEKQAREIEEILSSINNEYNDMFMSNQEKVNDWYKSQVAALDAVKGQVENYTEEREKLDQIYLQKHQEAIDADVQATIDGEEKKRQAYENALYETGDISGYMDYLDEQLAADEEYLAGKQELMDTYNELWKESTISTAEVISEVAQSAYSGLTDAFANVINGASSAKEAWNDLKNAFLKNLGIMVAKWAAAKITMWVLEQLYGKQSQTQATTQATTTAAAWAPAAAMASLASFGGNAAPAMLGIAATNALAYALASIPALAEGGITTGPTLAMIGDNPGGREAVIPLDKYDLFNEGTSAATPTPTPINNYSINAVDAKSFKSFLEDGGGAAIEKYVSKQSASFAY